MYFVKVFHSCPDFQSSKGSLHGAIMASILGLKPEQNLDTKASVMSSQAVSLEDFRASTLGWVVRQAFLSTLP